MRLDHFPCLPLHADPGSAADKVVQFSNTDPSKTAAIVVHCYADCGKFEALAIADPNNTAGVTVKSSGSSEGR